MLRSDIARNLCVERRKRQIYDDRWHFFAFLTATNAGGAEITQALRGGLAWLAVLQQRTFPGFAPAAWLALAVRHTRLAQPVSAHVAAALHAGFARVAFVEIHADSARASVARALIVADAPRAYAVVAEVAAALQVRGAGLSIVQSSFCGGRDAVATTSHAAVHAAAGTA